MDPLSIAGLTLAVFDQLLKIGERTAQLVSTYRGFDADSKTLENKIRDETNRTNTLSVLLFQPCAAYEDNSLFEQFNEGVQAQILLFLEHLKRGLITSLHGATLTPTKTPGLQQKAKIVDNLTDLNGRIHENIKLWCLATTIGIDRTHLKHLKSDDRSKELGFNIDADLQLTVNDSNGPAESLEIKDQALYECLRKPSAKIEDRFSICSWSGTPVLLEYRAYAPDMPDPVPIRNRTRDVVEKLTQLLHQPKEMVFRTPSCKGWCLDSTNNRVAFVFSLPPDMDETPFSLLSTVHMQIQPTLSQRYQLAHGLAKSISQLQLVKCVHESFRSENILLFPSPAPNTPPSKPESRLDFRNPWVFGFEFSRPELGFSSGRADRCLARDVYRHPSRQGRPNEPFKKLHDIYALGVVLLEIGLWQPALTLEREQFKRVRDPFTIQKFLVRHASKTLPLQVGEKYTEVVVRCLTGDFDMKDDTKEDLKLQQSFRNLVGLAIFSVLMLVIGGLGVPFLVTGGAFGWSIGALKLVYTFVYDITIGPVCYSLSLPSTRLEAKLVVLSRNSYDIAGIVNTALTPNMLNPDAWGRGKKAISF
ncbi:hypothetical protein B0A49_06328 [Cryomyces minteri]|uniref:Protein kinase domain-containing protein n=1 Tax=Cryomyces minteri TaxID=331657 RepID=A0A4U0WP93_9PEZI|nr:hypothetical protein B0A49_06328 [Cryomyces minteri]